jgi:hypothetical protein
VQANTRLPRVLALLLVLAPALAGCSGSDFSDERTSRTQPPRTDISDLLQSGHFLRDAEWFSRPGRLSIRNVSIDAPPLNPNEPLKPEDFVGADGACAGMAPPGSPAGANAPTDGAAGASPRQQGTVVLGHTECDVVRGIGAPDSINISSNPRGERVAVVTWSRGARAGLYTFTAGRLSSIERGAEPVDAPQAAKPKSRKKPTAS